MSGIITGPYFLAYFKQPSRSKIGTMVAILEVGAFGASSYHHARRHTTWEVDMYTLYLSHVPDGGPTRRHSRQETYFVLWCHHIRVWWCDSGVHPVPFHRGCLSNVCSLL